MPQINPRNLKTLRKRKRWSLSKLADESGVEKGTISRIENGKRPDNRAHTVEQLAGALAVTPDILTGPDMDQQKDVEPAKSKMNLRISNDVRNALSLVASRYGVKPEHVVQAAPLLFLWAAEESLKRRQQNLASLFDAWSAAEQVKGFAHLDGNLTHHWRGEEIALEEQRSISKRDIFGKLIDREALAVLSDDDDEDDLNPMTRFVADLVEPLGDLAAFRYWSPYSGPQFTMGRDEASALVDGDTDAAEAIVDGIAALHELPKDVRDSGPEQIACWAKERAEEARKELEEFIGGIDLSGAAE